jgi:hypothetical protein
MAIHRHTPILAMAEGGKMGQHIRVRLVTAAAVAVGHTGVVDEALVEHRLVVDVVIGVRRGYHGQIAIVVTTITTIIVVYVPPAIERTRICARPRAVIVMKQSTMAAVAVAAIQLLVHGGHLRVYPVPPGHLVFVLAAITTIIKVIVKTIQMIVLTVVAAAAVGRRRRQGHEAAVVVQRGYHNHITRGLVVIHFG